MTTYVDTQLEEIERALMIALKTKLPTTLAQVASEMSAQDASYFPFMGVERVPATPIPMPTVFIEGHDPLVLERPLEDFPNLATVCYRHPLSGPGGEADLDQIDQAETVLSTVYAEIFCNSDDQGTVNRMAKRYAKAMHRAVQMDFTLGGIAQREQVSPEVTLSSVVPAQKTDMDDTVTYFQGARLQYTFKTITGPYW